MLGYLARRLLWAVGTLIITAFFAYGMIRLLRPELYPGEALVGGTVGQVRRALLELDLGESCMFTGCPPLRQMWLDGVWADLFLLAGGVAVALVFGVAGGVWCAARPRSRASRALESVAMVFLCSPVYVIGFGVLLLFAPPFGLFELPWFFDPHSYAPPLENPWDFVRSMLMPWLIVGAPLAAAILRLTLALVLDTMGEDYVRTARAKGVPHPARRAPARRAADLRLDRLPVRRVGADHGHEHGARRVRVLRAGLLPPHAAGARPGARLAADDRLPDAPGARAVGVGADRRAEPAGRHRDRTARPAGAPGG